MFSNSTVRYAVLQQSQQTTRHDLRARRRTVFAATLLALSAALSSAQPASAQGGARLGNDSASMRERKPPTAQQMEERRKMIAEFEQRIEKGLFDRLQATDEQKVKLRALKKRLDPDKNQLFKDEGDFRRAMRTELTAAAPAEAKLVELLDKWPGLQRRRIDIQEREQRELAKILTPLQRARFFSFEDEFRRARQETQWGRDGRGGRGGPPGGMPGMRGDSTGGKRNGDFRGGGQGGGRGSRTPGKDTLIKK